MTAPWILVNEMADDTVFVGPFATEEEAHAYMESWPEDEDLTEQYIAPLNDPSTVGEVDIDF